MSKKSSFTDKRGTIKDLLVTDEYSLTHITFKKDAVRGNHYHNQTLQIDFILKGKLLVSLNGKEQEVSKGSQITIPQGMKHAYKGLEESAMLSICFGVRKGKDYEKDVVRLEIPLLK